MLNIESIAKRANVSIATVSRTLRSPNNLKTDKQRRIIDIAKQLGYDFNKLKKRTLSRKSRQILFLSFSKTLSPETLYSNDTYLPIVNGINKIIGKEDYDLIVSNVGVDEKPPPSLLRNDVDGIIFHGLMSNDFFQKYIHHLPHVGIQHYDPRFKCNWVMTDQWSVAFQSMEYLYQLGHRYISFLSNAAKNYAFQERYRGYQDALKYFNLPLQKEFALIWEPPRVKDVIPFEIQVPDFSPQIKKLMNCKTPPSAIICSGDFQALATSNALNKMGLSVPDDISIMGTHNENPFGGFTGCSCNLHSVCAHAAQLIMSLINGENMNTVKIMLQPDLYVGTSTKAVH